MGEQAAVNADVKTKPHEDAVWSVLGDVMDPEIPVLSVVELGIVRYAHWTPRSEEHTSELQSRP